MNNKLTYKNSGVNIEAGNALVKRISPLIDIYKESYSKFAGFHKLKDCANPVLVSSCDGVGTKIKIAIMQNKFDTIGIDLVAMSVNDIVTSLAKPLFFLDYISIGKLNQDIVFEIIKGIKLGCEISGCSLLGGETAEMPDFYNQGEFDLAGFAVGIVDEGKIPDINRITKKDVIIGIHSSGLHSNGFSLCRKLFFEKMNLNVSTFIDELGCTLGEELLKPTIIYTDLIIGLADKFQIKGLAHITGGGIIDNIPRSLPLNMQAIIDTKAWRPNAVFDIIQNESNLDKYSMFNTFNMGIGMVLIVEDGVSADIISSINNSGYKAEIIGNLIEKNSEECVKLI